jgi:hypothetical protein
MNDLSLENNAGVIIWMNELSLLILLTKMKMKLRPTVKKTYLAHFSSHLVILNDDEWIFYNTISNITPNLSVPHLFHTSLSLPPVSSLLISRMRFTHAVAPHAAASARVARHKTTIIIRPIVKTKQVKYRWMSEQKH